ncbi:MAG TPA: DUF2489 domain-containing protein [Casimicrobium sp.]|nr:DUF2489 domain-containing protein [Hyphomonadaceae bacterium]HPG61851.1 DUF2489 domain-containing protein [Casimicrobium sp.]
MTDRPAINEHEAQARESLVSLAVAMLEGRVSFFEGAAQVLRLKSAVGGIADGDPHFDAFSVIASETDHLPLSAQQHLWNAKALADLRPEFERTEEWASGFAPAACRGLIERFRGSSQ